MSWRRWLLMVVGGAVMLIAACAAPSYTHPVRQVVVGILHIDERAKCSWVTHDGTDIETIWLDGTSVDVSRSPAALVQDGTLVARAGEEVQATVSPDAAVKPVGDCPVASGSKVVGVTHPQLHRRP